jgi:hypothetical protein
MLLIISRSLVAPRIRAHVCAGRERLENVDDTLEKWSYRRVKSGDEEFKFRPPSQCAEFSDGMED